jgi:Lysylphosphatidylglycerol synthase TM region
VLWATFAAVGRPLPAAALVVAYIVGYLATLVPIPGSVGILDGGLAGALIVYGAHATQAAAAVVVYHAIAFWLPSIGGLIAYSLLRGNLSLAETSRIAIASSSSAGVPQTEGTINDQPRNDDRPHTERLGRLPHERHRARPLQRPAGKVARVPLATVRARLRREAA